MSFRDGFARTREDRWCVWSTIEEQVEESEVRDEADVGVALRIRRVTEALPDRRDTGACEHRRVEIVGRAAAAREVDAGAELRAHVGDALGLRAAQLERRCAHDRDVNPEPVPRE